MQKPGNWKPYNVKAILDNVRLVFKSRDISKLNKPAYEFIHLNMGFIAHYNLQGFQDEYRDLREFAKALQTSEYGSSFDYNLNDALRKCEEFFVKSYGKAYCESERDTMRGIVQIARQYQNEMEVVFGAKQRDEELFTAKVFAERNGMKLVPK